jgi:hypothetical protein
MATQNCKVFIVTCVRFVWTSDTFSGTFRHDWAWISNCRAPTLKSISTLPIAASERSIMYGITNLHRFSVLVIAVSLLAFSGCATNQWNCGGLGCGLLSRNSVERQAVDTEDNRPGFWHQTFGQPSGSDPTARDIERRLGIGVY